MGKRSLWILIHLQIFIQLYIHLLAYDHCEGCCNKELQELVPSHIVTIDELVDIVKEAKSKFDIEGITISGGEPSLQNGLFEFNKVIRDLGLGIIMFSGKKTQLSSDLVSSVDLLIDGPFRIKELDNERVLVGSKNKNLSFITNRYLDDENYFYNKTAIEEITVENYVFINED